MGLPWFKLPLVASRVVVGKRLTVDEDGDAVGEGVMVSDADILP